MTCLRPENRITRCEPHSRPLPQPSGLGCDQSTSGSFKPFSTDRYSMSLVQGMTLTKSDPAESKIHRMMAHSSALKPASRIACRQHANEHGGRLYTKVLDCCMHKILCKHEKRGGYQLMVCIKLCWQSLTCGPQVDSFISSSIKYDDAPSC